GHCQVCAATHARRPATRAPGPPASTPRPRRGSPPTTAWLRWGGLVLEAGRRDPARECRAAEPPAPSAGAPSSRPPRDWPALAPRQVSTATGCRLLSRDHSPLNNGG